MIRKTLTLCLALAAAPAFAAFDGDVGPAARCGPPVAMLTDVLQLRPDQVTTVESILTEQRQAHRESRQANRDQHQAMRQQTRDKLAAVLDAEQLARFDGFTQGMRMGGKGMRRNCGGADTPAGANR